MLCALHEEINGMHAFLNFLVTHAATHTQETLQHLQAQLVAQSASHPHKVLAGLHVNTHAVNDV